MYSVKLVAPIIPALFLILLASYYSQNYTDILASPLNCIASYLSYYATYIYQL